MNTLAGLFRACALLLLSAAPLGAAHAQAYPSKQVHLILTNAAGHPLDVVSRLIATKLTLLWGQPVVVENKPGGNLIIATDYVVKSAPDGYTLLSSTSQMAQNQVLLKLPYDTLRDLAPVTRFLNISSYLVMDGKLGAGNLREWVALAKANPGKYNFSTPGNATVGHMIAVKMNDQYGLNVVHVPYTSTGPALQAVLAGDAALTVVDLASIKAYAASGRLKILGVTGATRSSYSPDVPTLQENGLPFVLDGWAGILAPAGTPEPILNKVAADVGKVLALPDVLDWYHSVGMDTYTSTPAQFRDNLKREIDSWAVLIKASGIKVEQ